MISTGMFFEEHREKYKLHYCAGKKGFSRQISWVSLAEDISTLSYLKGGELIITTGLASGARAGKDARETGFGNRDTVSEHSASEWIESLVRLLAEREASGLIINTGEYLMPSDITKEITDICSEEGLPLFLMPWDIHIAELMQTACNEILSLGRRDEKISRLFSDLIDDRRDYREKAIRLEEFGFENDCTYNTLEVAGLASGVFLGNRLDQMGIRHFVLSNGRTHTVIIQGCPEKKIYEFVDSVYTYFGSSRGDSIKSGVPVIGMGEEETQLEKLRFTYMNGVNALKIAQRENVNFFRFKELGFYQILLSIPDTDLLLRLEKEYLGPLEKYDAENDTELTETLSCYLTCGGSVNEAAQKLFTHRNTVNYRMHKIREMLPFDMDDPDNRFILKMAFYIRDYLL